MTVKPWGGMLIGAFVALVVPISFLAVAKLMDIGIVLIVRESSTMQSLTSIALTEAFLGPIGIAIVGRSGSGKTTLVGLLPRSRASELSQDFFFSLQKHFRLTLLKLEPLLKQSIALGCYVEAEVMRWGRTFLIMEFGES